MARHECKWKKIEEKYRFKKYSVSGSKSVLTYYLQTPVMWYWAYQDDSKCLFVVCFNASKNVNAAAFLTKLCKPTFLTSPPYKDMAMI